jgi:hypothetical protein
VSHFRAEEDALLPALRTRRALMASLCDDHRRFAELRDAVAAARGDDAIHAALTAFADLLEAHVRREREPFAFFPEGIGEAETRRIGDAIRAVLATRDPARYDTQD